MQLGYRILRALKAERTYICIREFDLLTHTFTIDPHLDARFGALFVERGDKVGAHDARRPLSWIIGSLRDVIIFATTTFCPRYNNIPLRAI